MWLVASREVYGESLRLFFMHIKCKTLKDKHYEKISDFINCCYGFYAICIIFMFI